MRKPDEIELMRWALEHGSVIDKAGTYESKRVRRILEKWIERGWWDCGVSPWAGWLTEAGREALRKAVGE